MLFLSGMAYAQVQPVDHTLLSVQNSFESGELDVETAAIRQLELLERPVSGDHSIHVINKCITPATMFLHQHQSELSPAVLAKANDLGLTEPES